MRTKLLAAAISAVALGGVALEALAQTKPAVTSLREIAAGKVHFHRITNEVVNEWVRQQQALQLTQR